MACAMIFIGKHLLSFRTKPMYVVMVAYVKSFGLTLCGCKFIIHVLPLVYFGYCNLKSANSGERSFTYISPVAICNTNLIKKL